MADDSGSSGLLGVLVGAMLIIFVASAFFMYSGNLFPQRGPSFTIQLPK